jgi:anti-sigma B factor antagonist
MTILFKSENDKLQCIFLKDIIASAITEMRGLLNVTLDNQQDWNYLILDMTKVEKIDSLGINLIVWLFKMTQASDKDFKIIGCNEKIMRVFRLFRLQEQFTIESLE